VIGELQNGADGAHDASFALAQIYKALGEFDPSFAADERRPTTGASHDSRPQRVPVEVREGS
jgi:hypothetical protein